MRFEHPIAAIVSFGIFLILYALWNRRKGGRYFGFSDVGFFPKRIPFRQMLVVYLPATVFILISLMLFLALSRPKMKNSDKFEKVLARDIVLVIDMSYSMQMKLPGPQTVYRDSEGAKKKIDAAKEVAIDFIGKRKNDRFGIMNFGDDTFGLWPMTTDHSIVSSKVAMLDTEDGYGFLGSTNLVQAIDSAIAYIEKDSDAKEPILIFISDGEGSITDNDSKELIYRLQARKIHFYWIQIENGTAVQPSPIAKIVSYLEFGKQFSADDKMEIKQAIAQIDQVEKTRTVFETSGGDRDIYPQLCFLAAGLVIGVIFLEGYRL